MTDLRLLTDPPATAGIEHLLTAQEVADILRVTRKWLYSSPLRDKALRIHSNRNGLRWRPSDVRRFIEEAA